MVCSARRIVPNNDVTGLYILDIEIIHLVLCEFRVRKVGYCEIK